VFDQDDVVAQWVTTLGLAWNDLELANRSLIHGLQHGGRSSDNFRDIRMVLIIREISDFLRESQEIDEIAAEIKGSLARLAGTTRSC
jgi:hypothetical protein